MGEQRRALVTGSAGFVGRHMVAELMRRGWHVDGIDLDWYPKGLGAGIVGGQYLHMQGDAVEAMRSPWATEQFDLVVHCAYHVGGRAAIDGEPRNLARNLELDATLFDWAIRTRQRAVLYFSSSAAYPVELQTEYARTVLAEDDIDLDAVRQPDARYGWAKLTGEQLARSAGDAGLRVHVVRPFSGYGSDQDLAYPFPDIVRRIVVDGDLSVWGPPGQCRDWIHIDDVVRGALAVVDADERRPVNLCTGRATEMGELARQIAYADGFLRPDGPQPDVEYLLSKPTGVRYRVGDPTRMSLHYEPTVSLAEGIRRALGDLR